MLAPLYHLTCLDQQPQVPSPEEGLQLFFPDALVSLRCPDLQEPNWCGALPPHCLCPRFHTGLHVPEGWLVESSGPGPGGPLAALSGLCWLRPVPYCDLGIRLGCETAGTESEALTRSF